MTFSFMTLSVSLVVFLVSASYIRRHEPTMAPEDAMAVSFVVVLPVFWFVFGHMLGV